jgi:hypothetical protein
MQLNVAHGDDPALWTKGLWRTEICPLLAVGPSGSWHVTMSSTNLNRVAFGPAVDRNGSLNVIQSGPIRQQGYRLELERVYASTRC